MHAVLLIDASPELAAQLARSLDDDALEKVEIGVGLESSLQQPDPQRGVLVVGPQCEEPVKVAEQAAAADPELAVVILCASPSHREQVAQGLRFSPFVGSDVRCLDPESDESPGDVVRAAALRTRQRRSYQTLLEEVESSTVAVRAFPHSPSVLLDRLLDHVPIGVTALDAAFTVAAWNHHASEILESSESRAVGSRLEELLPAPASAAIAELTLRTRDLPGASASVSVQRARSDGAVQHLEVIVSSLVDLRGEPGWFVLFRDVTQRMQELEVLRRTTEELSQANRELEEFNFVASHDLQEPLRKLASFTALLEQDLGAELSEDVRTDLHFIGEGARRMQKLVQDLLALSRTGRADLHRERVELGDCADRALVSLELLVAEKAARITRDPLPELEVDATLVAQLYQNLIGNALKFAGSGPAVIHLSAEYGSEGWVLGVRDAGIGIPAAQHEEIFRAFRRLHAKEDRTGTGIGLAICRNAVERHGGWIRVESEPGHGAHFRFSLGEACESPRRVASRQDAGPQKPPASG